MAYDKNDPADKKLFDDAIAAALAEQAAEHETATAGLKAKRDELLGKLAKANEGKTDAAEVAKLEGQLETLQAKHSALEKDHRTATKSLKDMTDAHGVESTFNRKLLVDNGLNDALVAAKVAPHFLPAAKALLAGQVTIKVDGENRVAMVGEKPLGDFVTTWAQGEHGKIYVTAAVNGGGDAPGGNKVAAGAQTATRSEFDSFDQSARATFAKAGGQVID